MSETNHEHGDQSHQDEEGHGHESEIGKYLMVFVCLCILTGASFFTYSSYWPFRDTPSVGWAFMMAVSCTKALLVILFFMHLLWEANWKYVLTVPATFMSLFLVLMLIPDVGLRMRHASRERLLHAADPRLEHSDTHGTEHYRGKSAEDEDQQVDRANDAQYDNTTGEQHH